MPKLYKPAFIPKLKVHGVLIDTIIAKDGSTIYLIEDDLEDNNIDDTKGIEVWNDNKYPIYLCRLEEFVQL